MQSSSTQTTPLAFIGQTSIDLFQRCIEGFGKHTNPSTDISPQNRSMFTCEYEKLKTWTTSLGLFVSNHGSLDYRLRDKKSLRDTSVSFLKDLNQYLKDTLMVLDNVAGGPDQVRRALSLADTTESDDDDDEVTPQWYIGVMLESITHVIDRLNQASMLVNT